MEEANSKPLKEAKLKIESGYCPCNSCLKTAEKVILDVCKSKKTELISMAVDLENRMISVVGSGIDIVKLIEKLEKKKRGSKITIQSFLEPGHEEPTPMPMPMSTPSSPSSSIISSHRSVPPSPPRSTREVMEVPYSRRAMSIDGPRSRSSMVMSPPHAAPPIDPMAQLRRESYYERTSYTYGVPPPQNDQFNYGAYHRDPYNQPNMYPPPHEHGASMHPHHEHGASMYHPQEHGASSQYNHGYQPCYPPENEPSCSLM